MIIYLLNVFATIFLAIMLPISGWWKVNDQGEIEGKFIPNPDHDPHLEKSCDPP
ncbi:MAG: hypothetical protein ACFFBQ_19435 [Promethearchaeota archaeon]